MRLSSHLRYHSADEMAVGRLVAQAGCALAGLGLIDKTMAVREALTLTLTLTLTLALTLTLTLTLTLAPEAGLTLTLTLALSLTRCASCCRRRWAAWRAQ